MIRIVPKMRMDYTASRRFHGHLLQDLHWSVFLATLNTDHDCPRQRIGIVTDGVNLKQAMRSNMRVHNFATGRQPGLQIRFGRFAI